MKILNLKRTLGRKYKVTFDPKTDGRGPEFYTVSCFNGYIAPLNATELLIVRWARNGDEIRAILSEFPVVRENDKLIAVAVLPKDLPEIVDYLQPVERPQLVVHRNGMRILPMPPKSHWQADARAA